MNGGAILRDQLWHRKKCGLTKGEPMHSWIPVLVFSSVALTVYWVLIPRQRRQQRRWSTDGGSGDFSTSSNSGSGWSFGDWSSSSSSTDSSGQSPRWRRLGRRRLRQRGRR